MRKPVLPSVRDLSGLRFGLLLVTDAHEVRKSPSGKGAAWWLCRCDCLEKRWIRSNSLVQGESLSCGCAFKQQAAAIEAPLKRPKFRDLEGQRFGRLVALSYEIRRSPQGSTHYLWQCACDCGEKANVRGACLANGDTRSCGCLRKEKIAIAQAASRGLGARSRRKNALLTSEKSDGANSTA